MCVCVHLSVCVVGGGGSDWLVALECVVVCGWNDKGWMKVSCPIVCAVWAAAVAAFFLCEQCVCMFFVLQGVCALCTSTPLGKCNRCAFQCSSRRDRVEGLKAGWRGVLTSLRVLWPSMHPVHEISPWPPASGCSAVSEKKAKECGS